MCTTSYSYQCGHAGSTASNTSCGMTDVKACVNHTVPSYEGTCCNCRVRSWVATVVMHPPVGLMGWEEEEMDGMLYVKQKQQEARQATWQQSIEQPAPKQQPEEEEEEEVMWSY